MDQVGEGDVAPVDLGDIAFDDLQAGQGRQQGQPGLRRRCPPRQQRHTAQLQALVCLRMGQALQQPPAEGAGAARQQQTAPCR